MFGQYSWHYRWLEHVPKGFPGITLTELRAKVTSEGTGLKRGPGMSGVRVAWLAGLVQWASVGFDKDGNAVHKDSGIARRFENRVWR